MNEYKKIATKNKISSSNSICERFFQIIKMNSSILKSKRNLALGEFIIELNKYLE